MQVLLNFYFQHTKMPTPTLQHVISPYITRTSIIGKKRSKSNLLTVIKSMTKQIQNIILCSLLLLIATEIGNIYRFADGAQRTIHVSDDLDDVVDDEEDEAWREWGRKKSPSSDFDPPPTDFGTMSPSEIQAEMMKRQTGPVFGFVKLRLGTRRTQV